MGMGVVGLFDFIDSIPDSRLTGDFSALGKTIYRDQNFRMDMQGMTTGSKAYNVQIQVNKGTSIKTLKGFAPKSATTLIIPVDAGWTPDEVRAKFKANKVI